MPRRITKNFLRIPTYLWFFLLFLGPLLIVVQISFAKRDVYGFIQGGFQLQSYIEAFQPLYLKILGKTLVFALGTSLLTILFSYPVAAFLWKVSPKYQTTLLTLFLFPMWINYLLRLLAIMDLFRAMPESLNWLYTQKGIFFTLIYVNWSCAFLPLFSAFSKLPVTFREVAQDLGANKWQTFTKVIFPLTKKGVLQAFVFVFIPCFGEYLIPELIGGGRHFFMGNFLQSQFLTARNWPLGSAFIVGLLGMILITTFYFMQIQSQKEKKDALAFV
ncbi:MAG: ABC transporter permease [Proteobacteria bacterium]|nr:ABC transporter permease [Pseudomonadota bacterium]